MTEERKNPIEWIYSTKDNEELLKRYDEWAASYDDDLTTQEEHRAPAVAAEVLYRLVPKNAKLLDAGAGTGLLGEVLAAAGYGDAVAIDLSQGMLDVAEAKGVYRELHRMVLGEHLDFPANAFDAVAATGVFTAAHAPASSFQELVRVARPGGHIVFTLSEQAYEESGFKEALELLESQGNWALVEKTDSMKLTNDSPYEHRVWAFQVTG